MNYRFIGWCQEGNSDKVWGVIYLETPKSNFWCADEKCVIFWGRRGKKLQTKAAINNSALSLTINSKLKKGYERVDYNKLHEVYPEFEDDLRKTEFWAILKY